MFRKECKTLIMSIKGSRFVLVVMFVISVNIVLIVSVSGLNLNRKSTSIFDKIKVKEGDLVFRNGYGMISRWFQRCSLQDPSFSHAGIVVFNEGQPFVVHLQPSSYSSPLHMEKISDFWKKDVCNRGALYRPELSVAELKKMISSVKNDLNNVPDFDYEFNLEDHQKFYCSEWVREKFILATGKNDYFPVTSIENFTYIAPDNLYLNERTKLIYRFSYK